MPEFASGGVKEWGKTGNLRTVTRRVSEEERPFLADASGYNDPLLAAAVKETWRIRPTVKLRTCSFPAT